nr:vacuolar protein sorting-associated protein 32 like 1 [Quercus suber]
MVAAVCSDPRAAIQCWKRKRLYEQQIEQLGNFQLRIQDQMILLEGAKATTETVDALRTGAAARKAMQKATLSLSVKHFFVPRPWLIKEGFILDVVS